MQSQGDTTPATSREGRSAVAASTATASAGTTTFVEHFYHITALSTAQPRTRAGRKPTSKQVVASRLYNLSLDIAALQQQLQQLELHRSLLQTRALYTQRSDDGSAVKTTVAYWDVFRRGFRSDDSRQPAFVMSVMDEALRLGVTPHGRHELLQQWELYTDYFAIRRYDLHDARVVACDASSGTCVTRSDGQFRGCFTQRGLAVVFPAVLRDQELTQQLLTAELTTSITVLLHFNAVGAVVRHDGAADFFNAIRGALGSAVRAAQVVEVARLWEESMVEDQAVLEESDRREPLQGNTVDVETRASSDDGESDGEGGVSV